jgi:hypothetical protein
MVQEWYRVLSRKLSFIFLFENLKENNYTMLSKLPINLLLRVVGENVKVARNLVFSLPKFGRYSLNFQVELQRSMTIVYSKSLPGMFGLTPISGKIYRLNGKNHRPSCDGPAIEWVGGDQKWYNHGVLHRPQKEGPAVFWRFSGKSEYWENGIYKN